MFLVDQAINFWFIVCVSVGMWIINGLQTWKQYKKKDYLHFSVAIATKRQREANWFRSLFCLSFSVQISRVCHFLLFNIANNLLCGAFDRFVFISKIVCFCLCQINCHCISYYTTFEMKLSE